MPPTFENDELRHVKFNGHTDAAPMVVTYPYDRQGFDEGRQFRMFRELGPNEDFVIQATVPVDVMLIELAVDLIEGECIVETVIGGTPSGSFDTPLAMFNQNNMSTAGSYTRQASLDEGGAHTGGTLLDVLQAKSSGSTAHASHVAVTSKSARGIAPGLYYFRVATANNTTGVISVQWEEYQ